MPHALISLYLTSLSLLPLFHSSAIIPPRTCCLSTYLYNSILNNSSSTDYVLFRCQNLSFFPIAFSYSSGNIVPCACLRVSLTCSLFRYNVFFFRDRYRCLSRTTFVAILPFSAICSSPSTSRFRTLLRFTCSRPLARSPPLTPTLSRDLRSVQWLLQALSFYRRKTLREHVCPDGEHWSARADFENVFIGYVNLPITRFPDF